MPRPPPPMATVTLRQMAERHRSGEMRALLWEVYRLRSVLVALSSIERDLSGNALALSEDATTCIDDMRRVLWREPAVREHLQTEKLNERERQRIARGQRG